jgi:putative DNA primase/helicase
MELPDSLLTIESVDDALLIYCEVGLRPITIHAPIPVVSADGTTSFVCSCGKFHDTTASGSSSIGKHPIVPNWQKREFKYEDLRDQVARQKFIPNLGVVLGKQPGGEYLIAIDVDDADRVAVLEQELGPLPPTPRCDSGRGYRLFYSAPSEIDVAQLQNVTALTPGATGKDKIPGVDAKAESGQVVVAPSLHANGKRYRWTVAGPVARLPVHWAMQLLKQKLEIPKFVEKYTPAEMTRPGRPRKQAENYLNAAVTGSCRALAACTQGNRNNTLYATARRMFGFCAGMSQSHQWQWVHDELLRAARACGLPEDESLKTIASAERKVRESGETKVPVPMVRSDGSSAATGPSFSPEPGSGFPEPPDDETPAPAPGDKPRIKVTHELFKNVDEAIVALRADDNLYQREQKLVCITQISREQSENSAPVASDDGKIHRQLVEGTPLIIELEMPNTRERLSKVAIFQKWVEKQQRYVSIMPTDEIVSSLHKRKGDWPGIRTIVGVVETPILRPDGVVIQDAGYDKITHYVYVPSTKFPDIVDDHATRDNACWAFKFLSEIFADFPYVNDAHRSVPIAAILTLVARPAILGSIPAILFDASTRGSGKTLQTDAVAMVVTGRGAPRMNYTTDEIELEKILAGYALKGSPFICLDNVPAMRPFGGGPIDRVITARDEVELRVLGATKVLTMPWRALVMATGNNMSLYGDTSRRVLLARLEPTEESPEHRTKFKHDDLLGWIRSERPRMVAAALLILRAYWCAGRPNMGCARWGSFEEWSRLIPHAIKFAGGADPMGARPEAEEEVDNDLRSIRCIMTRLREIQGDDWFRISSIVELLYRCERPRDKDGNLQADGLEDLRDAIETLVGRRGMKFEGRSTAPDPVELGKRLGAFKGRIIGGLRLTTKSGGGGVMRWRIESTVGPNLSLVPNPTE